MEVLAVLLVERNRIPSSLFSLCSIPMAKETTHHPHRGTDVLIKLIKTVRRNEIVVLLVDMREVLCFTRFLEVPVTLHHSWILRTVFG